MKVLVVHNLKQGGGWRRLHEQAARLDAEVVELTLATATPVTDEPIVVPYTPRAPLTRRALRAPLRYSDAARLALAWRRLAAQARELEADVIYANPCQFLHAPPILLRNSLPALYYCDETRRIDHEPQAAAGRNPRTRALYAPLYAYERRLDTASTRRAPTLVTNSLYSVDRLRSAYGVEAGVVKLGVADAFLCGPTNGPRDDFVLSVGMLTRFKGHDLAIAAAARSKTLRRVVIVSPRPADAEEHRLRRLASDVGVVLDVQVAISDEALRALYAKARVTSYLARAEPFGLVAIEAQACGCPVVAAAEGGLLETIIEGETGFAVPRNADAAAVAFDRLCEPETSARVGANAATHGRSWSWDASASRIRTLLAGLAATR